MTCLKTCDNCGAKIEIEDHDNLSHSGDDDLTANENLKEVVVCDICALTNRWDT